MVGNIMSIKAIAMDVDGTLNDHSLWYCSIFE